MEAARRSRPTTRRSFFNIRNFSKAKQNKISEME
jgi:hypothetical protein